MYIIIIILYLTQLTPTTQAKSKNVRNQTGAHNSHMANAYTWSLRTGPATTVEQCIQCLQVT